MADAPQYLLIVSAEIAREVEDAWNKWYDEEHLPEALACPGVLAGNRYVSVSDASLTRDGGKSTSSARAYVAVYELCGPEALETPEFIEMRGWYQFTDKITARTQVYKKL
ncbi:MAG: hypothetical protein HN478_13470 [Rhodospirillaceae bacterium]|jgi:hypothetical protein|nr:hypothetical protein [Rhodospirillaceae bacterium]MBT4489956.1 hypothetical protein [Rhodospirillaceae bacterium]MBT5454955.1 hypothetical protein [Rhodospirillaceae bacterium]MBT5896627.1 hypothetical protein [Rhodospirillaceae bacterium]MBT7760417.1 hypothetical protein [Rhodospirillaceae bacterium]